MSLSVSEKITDSLINNGTIETDDKELYLYGFQQGFFILLNFVTSIVIGLLLGMFWQSIIFTMTYLPLRTFAGGYHAKTPLRCYFSSILLITVTLLTIKFVPWNIFICIICTLASSLVVLILAPVEDQNKPLDDTEKVVYRRKAQVILSAIVFMILLFSHIKIHFIVNTIVTSLSVLAIMLIFGKIKNKLLK
ncbi:MAG: accessory gene regulator B family protein [Oscillospiraceae bacterium]